MAVVLAGSVVGAQEAGAEPEPLPALVAVPAPVPAIAVGLLVGALADIDDEPQAGIVVDLHDQVGRVFDDKVALIGAGHAGRDQIDREIHCLAGICDRQRHSRRRAHGLLGVMGQRVARPPDARAGILDAPGFCEGCARVDIGVIGNGHITDERCLIDAICRVVRHKRGWGRRRCRAAFRNRRICWLPVYW